MACECTFSDTAFLANTCGANFTVFMALVESLLFASCDIADPCHRLGRDGSEFQDYQEFDFVIVGAGVAGSVLAARLSENPIWKVLLIEAGPEEPTATQVPSFAISAIGTPLDWNYTTIPQQNACLGSGGICRWPRGKMVSGTGGMQGMMYTRGHPSIYNSWALDGNTGWSWEEVLPYFIKAENNQNMSVLDDGYHGFDGPLIVQNFEHHPELSKVIVAAAEELGYSHGDINGINQTGAAIAPMMVHDGLRGSTSRMYLRPESGRSNLFVATNSHVTKVIIDAETKLATGVEFIDSTGTIKIITASKEVILSAGAIGSPQILMLSGVGPAEDLSTLGINVIEDLPVGQNLHNHVSVSIGFFINDSSYQTLTLPSLNEYLDTHGGPLSGTGVTQNTAFLRSKYAPEGVPDLQVFFDGYIGMCSRTGSEEECTDGTIGNCPKRYINARPTNILPKSKGYMKLNSIDPFDYPLIDPQYFSAPEDLDVLVEGIKILINMSTTEAMKEWGFELAAFPTSGCEDLEYGSDEYWVCHVKTSTGPENHQAGSCRMGPAGDTNAVVDPELKVHGVPNLRVVDASIFPYVPNSNPIAAIIMAAEKASDMIKAVW